MRYAKKFANCGAVVLLGLTTSLATYAQTGGTTPSSGARSWVPFTSSGYVGGSIGRSDYDIGGCVVGFSCDDTATGFKLFAGGKFSPYFGLEVGYVNLGKADRNGGQVKAQGANLGLIGSLPVTDSFSIFGKLGGMYGWTNTSAAVAGAMTGKENGLGLSYGAGLQIDITKNVAIRGDWDRYRLKYVGQRDDADLYSIGAVFKF